MKNGKLTVAIVGMGFGSCFLPIYLKHRQGQHMMIIDGGNDFKVFYTIYRTQLSAGMPGEQRKGLTGCRQLGMIRMHLHGAFVNRLKVAGHGHALFFAFMHEHVQHLRSEDALHGGRIAAPCFPQIPFIVGDECLFREHVMQPAQDS